jgi:ribosomal protein S21
MSIIVHRDEPVDEALKRLHREALRENIFEVLNAKRYRIRPGEDAAAKRREWRKRKRRLRSARRKSRNKGI